MKVLHINSYYESGHFYKNLYDIQNNSKMDIEVFVPIKKGHIQANNRFDYGQYTRLIPSFDEIDRFFFFLKQKKIESKLEDDYSVKNFDLIHAHTLFSNGYLAYRMKKKYGVPYIVAVRNTDMNLFFAKMRHLRKIGVKILKEAKSIVFLSKPYLENLIEKYIPEIDKEAIRKKSVVIPNGIDEFWFNNGGTPRDKVETQSLKLLYVGEVNKNKNITTTIEAIKELKKEKIEATLTVVGKITDKKIFSEITKNDFVHYLTPRPKEELVKVYQSHDIFVMPSIHETFGLVYAEAMSQGLPVIYSKGQGFDGQFDEGVVGLRVEATNAIELRNCIIKILDNYCQISHSCLQNASVFKWGQIYLSYMEIYNLR